MGAYDTGDWETQVPEIKGSIGVLKRGTVLATGTGADVGKLVKLAHRQKRSLRRVARRSSRHGRRLLGRIDHG